MPNHHHEQHAHHTQKTSGHPETRDVIVWLGKTFRIEQSQELVVYMKMVMTKFGY
jgi:hypothetical protein